MQEVENVLRVPDSQVAGEMRMRENARHTTGDWIEERPPWPKPKHEEVTREPEHREGCKDVKRRVRRCEQQGEQRQETITTNRPVRHPGDDDDERRELRPDAQEPRREW